MAAVAGLNQAALPLRSSPTPGLIRCDGTHHPAVLPRDASVTLPNPFSHTRVLPCPAACQVAGAKSVWLSTPSWGNHAKIFEAAGLATHSYRYLDQHSGTSLDFDGILGPLLLFPIFSCRPP